MSVNVKHKRAFLIWLAIYPLITIMFLLLGDHLIKFPLAVRTLILTLIAVPLMALSSCLFITGYFTNG